MPDQYHVTTSRGSSLSLLTKHWFSIGSRAHVMLTCSNQGRVVTKPVNTNPGLKVNQSINISYIHVFHCFALCILRLFKIKTEGQTIYRKPAKLQYSNQNSRSSWVSLSGFAQLGRLLGLAKSIYIS